MQESNQSHSRALGQLDHAANRSWDDYSEVTPWLRVDSS